jgi:2-amino-4-hydroxy-6-hydroxymethyldihydropteridine diphosphokinase
MPRCLIALGANLGERRETLARAVELFHGEPHVTNFAPSRWHETAPVGGAAGQGTFLNGAATCDTTLSPTELHGLLRRIENELGRTRGQRWAARLLDLDLLLYDEHVIATPELIVPHPRMAFRRFVLEPAVEVAADMVHPTIGWSMQQLLAHLNAAVPYVALLGPGDAERTRLAQSLARHFGGRTVTLASSMATLSGSPNPPSQPLERQIQFLLRGSLLLDARKWPRDGVLAVSDFYLDQALAQAQTELAPGDLEAFRHAWETAQAHVMPPKLLAVLDDVPLGPVVPASGGVTMPGRVRQLSVAETSLAARRGIGPVVYAGSDPQQQFDEIAAAIVAMQ